MEISFPSIPRRWLAAIAIAVGLALAVYALFARKSDEELIREKLDELELAIEVDGNENPIFRGKRMKERFETLFTPAVRVDIRELTSLKSGRDDLVGVATRAGVYFRHAQVDISPDSVDLIAGGTAATVRGSAVLTGDRGHGPQRDERRVLFGFAKVDGDWLIDSLVVTPKDEAPPTTP